MEFKLLGHNYTTPDLVAKVTGKAKYAEDYRGEGMVFIKLMPSPRPHAKIRSIDATAALAMPGVHGILTAKDLPAAPPPPGGLPPALRRVPRRRCRRCRRRYRDAARGNAGGWNACAAGGRAWWRRRTRRCRHPPPAPRLRRRLRRRRCRLNSR